MSEYFRIWCQKRKAEKDLCFEANEEREYLLFALEPPELASLVSVHVTLGRFRKSTT